MALILAARGASGRHQIDSSHRPPKLEPPNPSRKPRVEKLYLLLAAACFSKTPTLLLFTAHKVVGHKNTKNFLTVSPSASNRLSPSKSNGLKSGESVTQPNRDREYYFLVTERFTQEHKSILFRQ